MTSLSEGKLPSWTACLARIGEAAAKAVSCHTSKRLTIAICLPRVDFAAAFIGLGIVKNSFASSESDLGADHMDKMLGEWVVYKNRSGSAFVGILEKCEVTHDYKICHYKRGTPDPKSMTREEWRYYSPPKSRACWTIISPDNHVNVQPAGREFNEERRVGSHQVKKLLVNDSSSMVLEKLLGFNLARDMADISLPLFTVYGKKARIEQEWRESLFEEKQVFLQSILRPAGTAEYNCAQLSVIESTRAPLSECAGAFAIIEAGRTLPDQLVSGKKVNRIILLGRNMPCYDESASWVMQEYENRHDDAPGLAQISYKPMRVLTYFHQ